MQWLATPLNALDSAIDRLTTPQRGGADNDKNDEEGNSNTANAGANGARSLVLDDDARAAAAEDDGFASSASLGVGGDERNAFGAQLEIGPLDTSAAVGDDQSVTQQTIDINDAMGAISPLKNDNDDDGEEGAFVNGIGRHGGRSMTQSDSLVGRAPPLPLHPNTKPRGSGAAMGPAPSAAAMDESQYVLETPPARVWPPQPKPQQQPLAAVDGPAADNAKPPTSQSKRSAPVSSKASSTGNTANGAGSSTAVNGISPFPGRLVKRARPPSPVNSLTEREEAQVKTGVEGYLSSFVGGDDDDDDIGNADEGGSAGAVDGSDDYKADATNEEEADRIRKAQEEAARLEAERIEAQRVEIERQRQREKEAEAERQRIAAAEEKARLEVLEAKRIADAKAAAEREAAVQAEMERQLREEAARRIAEQRRVEAQRKAREEEEARRIAAAAKEDARRRKAEEEETKRALEAEAKSQAQEEESRRRAVAEEQARIAAEQARVAAEAKAESERRLQEVEEQQRQKHALKKAKPNIQAPPVSAFTAPTESSDADQETVEGDLNDTSRDDDLDSEYEDYEVHLPLQPWDDPLVNIGKDGRDDGAIAEMSSFSSPLPPWDPAMNRRGVVQIRLLRAQRLPCSAGRSVRANITLPPWRGKVTTEWTKAYLGPEGIPPDQGGEDQSFQDVGAGVCARWDEEDIVEPNKGDTGDEFDEVSSDAQNAAVMTYNMVHHYNDTDTPVPEISIELTSTSMLGFESTMSVSVPLSVGVLMREPEIWRRRWCPTLVAGKDGAAQPSSPRRFVSGAVRGNGE